MSTATTAAHAHPAIASRFATRDDDARIRAFLGRIPLPGATTLAFGVEPSFFDALAVHGSDPHVIMGFHGDVLIGLGVMLCRWAYLNGEAADLGYLGMLRLDPAARGTRALVLGHRRLREVHEARHPGRFYLSSILEDSTAALRALTSGRAGLPLYRPVASLQTRLIPTFRRRPPRPPPGVSLCRGPDIPTARLLEHLNAFARRHQFAPCFRAEEWATDAGPWRGLRPEHMIVAERGGVVLGTIGVWDERPFRQHRVVAYAPRLAALTAIANRLAPLAGWTGFPVPGQEAGDMLAACMTLREDDVGLAQTLLRTALHDARRRGARFLAVGSVPGSPFHRASAGFLHTSLRSTVCLADWGDAGPAIAALDTRPPYLELGSL